MSEMTGGQRRIGLALSGGGFRAAAFHLGVFKKLKALGLLENISLLSCVSGGSIAGAFLALNWNDPDKALVDLENYLNEKS
ncbi:MAG: patatin-like phospholipase family protein, partial [Betaproteobacteria bacterium]